MGSEIKDVTEGELPEKASNLDVEAGEALNGNGNSAPKKNRQSLKNRIQAVSTERPPRKNIWKYVQGICGIFCVCAAGTAGGLGLCLCFGGILLLQLLPIASIVIGSLYLEDKYCPAEKIALLLLIGGIISMTKGFVTMFSRTVAKRKLSAGQPVTNGSSGSASLDAMDRILSLANLVWFVAACVIVFRLSPHVSYEESAPPEDYCHPLPFLFAYWITLISLIILIIVGFMFCCMCCCGVVGAAGNAANARANQPS